MELRIWAFEPDTDGSWRESLPLQQVKTQGGGGLDDPPLMRNPLKPSRQPVWCLQEEEAVSHPPGAAAAGCLSKRTSTTSTAQHSQFTGSLLGFFFYLPSYQLPSLTSSSRELIPSDSQWLIMAAWMRDGLCEPKLRSGLVCLNSYLFKKRCRDVALCTYPG